MGVTDNVKPYLKPKEWLIIGGVVQLGFAIWLMMDAEGFAEKAWTDLTASELEIATSYELFWGWFSVPWGIWAIMIATMVTGRQQARVAALTGLMLFLHGVVFFMLATGEGYSTDGPGPLLALVFFLPIVAIGLSGALNWNMEEELYDRHDPRSPDMAGSRRVGARRGWSHPPHRVGG